MCMDNKVCRAGGGKRRGTWLMPTTETSPAIEEHHQLPSLAVLPQPHWAPQETVDGAGTGVLGACIIGAATQNTMSGGICI